MLLRRSIVGIPIILILLPCLYCIYFQVRHLMLRQEMREKLETEQLQTVVVPVKDFKWYEKDREIIVGGVMFDVKSITQHKDNYIITGLFDQEETALHIAIGRLQHEQESGTGPDAELISLVLSQTLMPFSNGDILRFSKEPASSSRFIDRGEKLYNTILSIHTPPPRV